MFNSTSSSFPPAAVVGSGTHIDDDAVSGLSVPLIDGDSADDDLLLDRSQMRSAPPHTDAGRWQAMRQGAGGSSAAGRGISIFTGDSRGGGRSSRGVSIPSSVPMTIHEVASVNDSSGWEGIDNDGARGEKQATLTTGDKNQGKQGGKEVSWNDMQRQKSQPLKLLDLKATESIFKICTMTALITYVFLLTFGYSMIPSDNLVRLDGVEQQVAATAAIVFVVSILLTLIPMWFRKQPLSAVVFCGLIIQSVALTTNLLLAFAPTIILRDPITHARVFYVRWCEWIPLSGLMTILSEGIDIRTMAETRSTSRRGTEEKIIHTDAFAVAVPLLVGLGQSLSCFCGIILPYCPTVSSWSLAMFLSFVFYWSIFYRLYYKRKDYLDWKAMNKFDSKSQRATVQQKETHARLQFGYHLLTICSMCWTALVVIYFLVMAGKRCLPDDHVLHQESFAMVADTMFDLTAKFFYCKVIIEVHGQVFDPQARTRRQLDELRQIMNDLWETSKDVICILAIRTDSTNGVTGNTKATTMLSPAFIDKVVGRDDHDPNKGARENRSLTKKIPNALMVEGLVDRLTGELSNCTVAEVPATYTPYPFTEFSDIIDPSQLLYKEAVSIASAICHLEFGGRRRDELVVHDIHTVDPNSVRRCELQLNNASESQAVIAIARDVTERFKRHEAERRAHEETAARQQDAHNVNRFTRHEIKNGLLAGIEMCDAMRSTMVEGPLLSKSKAGSGDNQTDGDTDSVETPNTTLARHLMDLEGTLHEILDTVLAEATARDVIHEAYEPQKEALDIRDELYKSIGSAASAERFPVTISPPDMPRLWMDPQLLRYIHRNAISNAVKYGKRDGIIRTEVRYSPNTRVFELDVINQPGRHHADLVAMGPAASRAVFRSRTRLHNSMGEGDSDGENNFGKIGRLSAGDGAWIMEKCAKTLGGYCQIQFEQFQTVFSFRCQLDSCDSLVENALFQCPPGTWGVAVDDSVIQRRLMSRILSHVGIEKDHQILLGADPDEAETLEEVMVEILANNPKDRMLALIDENLDYVESHGKGLLGSKLTQRALGVMPASSSDRLLALIRSANDSAADLAMYNARAHGFFPKASMTKDRVRVSLAPLWRERFENVRRRIRKNEANTASATLTNRDTNYVRDESDSIATSTGLSVDDENDMITKQELRFSFCHVRSFMEQMDPSTTDWMMIWRHLHSLSGDLLAASEEIEAAGRAAEMIHSMRGSVLPPDLMEKWQQICVDTQEAIDMLQE